MKDQFPTIDRRGFLTAIAGLGVATAAGAAPKRRLKVGHTGITWGYKPEDAAKAIPDVASLGYEGYESFGNYFEPWEAKGGLKKLLDEHNLPLISAYCPVNLTDPDKRKDEVAKIAGWAREIRRMGGTTAVIGPNGVKRDGYDFQANKANIVAALNDIGKTVSDVGIIPALHQHTGTCVETREEVYAVLDVVDTRHVKFGPDVGQLQKGGSDPVKVLKDFHELVYHVHFKDWDGGDHWAAYCPLGRGKVDLPAVLDLLETAPNMKIVMVELDWAKGDPLEPRETAKIAKEYMIKQGYKFRS